MQWPTGVLDILSRLEGAGFEAWAVGGCVRDTLMGRIPSDWDVCTRALPAEMKAALQGLRIIETGLPHGTLTVLSPQPVEVTTYRVDGDYSDHRRPDNVRFVPDLVEDLSRRDFTMNAMAMHPERPLCDPFGGRADIEAKLVRCVGAPEHRFREDALRMLRCLRFAAQLDFAVEEGTARALEKAWPTLFHVSQERIGAEYLKLIVGPGAGRVIRQFHTQVDAISPIREDMEPHILDALPREPGVRMGYLLKNADCLPGLRLPNRLIRRVRTLLDLRSRPLPDSPYALKRLLSQVGEEAVRDLCALPEGQALMPMLEDLLSAGACFSLRDLALRGSDLDALGLQGPAVGKTLRALLDEVMAGRLPNQREALLEAALSLRSGPDSQG